MEAEQKQAGHNFHFAKEFNRKTMSRTDLTSFIQKRYEAIWSKTEEFQQMAEHRYAQVCEEKDEIAKQNLVYQEQMRIQ